MLNNSLAPNGAVYKAPLMPPHRYLDLAKSRRYLADVGTLCLAAAEFGDPREVIAALDVLRRMPMAVRSQEASL